MDECQLGIILLIVCVYLFDYAQEKDTRWVTVVGELIKFCRGSNSSIEQQEQCKYNMRTAEQSKEAEVVNVKYPLFQLPSCPWHCWLFCPGYSAMSLYTGCHFVSMSCSIGSVNSCGRKR